MSLDSKKPSIDFIRMALTLFLITSLVAVALAAANYFTAPMIENSAKKRLDESLRMLIPDASFEAIDEFESSITFGEDIVEVQAVYAAKDVGGASLGYCVQVAPNGYSDQIEMLVSIDGEGAVGGIQILAISDTPGIGMKVDTDETFQKSLIGITDTVKAVKTTPAVGEVQVISGASVSSEAYINGVNAAIEVVQRLMQEVLK